MVASTKPKVSQSKVRHGINRSVWNKESRKYLNMQSVKFDLDISVAIS